MGAEPDGPGAGAPKENPKSTALIWRVLISWSAQASCVIVSRGRARTQLHAVAFATAPLALCNVSYHACDSSKAFWTYWIPWWRNGVEVDASGW